MQTHSPTIRWVRASRWRSRLLWGILTALLLTGCSPINGNLTWKLDNVVEGHLPDLAFHLTDGNGDAVTAQRYRGKVVLLYFGYTHCPDVCPMTLARLHQVMLKLGKLADQTRILFVSVDPARDTPAIMHQYAKAFDRHVIGLTGTPDQIRTMAKRYRVSFSRGPDLGHGNYEVSHSAGIYLFDRKGRARALATNKNTVDDITHDVRELVIATGNNT